MERITQKELKDYLELETKINGFKLKLKDLTTDLEARELTLVDRLDNGANVESGKLLIDLKESDKRSIQWKKHFVDMLGEEAANKIMEETEFTTYKHIKVVKG